MQARVFICAPETDARDMTYVNQLILYVLLHHVLVINDPFVVMRSVTHNVNVVAFFSFCIVVDIHVKLVILDWL